MSLEAKILDLFKEMKKKTDESMLISSLNDKIMNWDQEEKEEVKIILNNLIKRDIIEFDPLTISLKLSTKKILNHIGIFNPEVNPIIPGGLSKDNQISLESIGWKRKVTKSLLRNMVMGFSDPNLPGGFTLRVVDIPKGTEYLYNPEEARVILVECGNPSPCRPGLC